jgi:hypothetical protein
MVRVRRAVAVAPLAALLVWAGSATAADVVVFNRNLTAAAPTPAEIAAIKPYKNPLPAPDSSAFKADTRAAAGLVAGGVPGKRIGNGGAAPTSASGDTRAFGSFGIPFAEGRVMEGTSNAYGNENYLSTTFPYSAVGKLTFNGGYCSAAVIRRGIIVTAAHCIQLFGSHTGLFGGWRFIPATWGPSNGPTYQYQPYGIWTWKGVVRPGPWAAGTDIGSGSARDNDIAVIALDKLFGDFIGDIVGQLGYGWNNYSFKASEKTGNLQIAATTTLGYPALLDTGNMMQRADGPTFTTIIVGAHQLWQGNNFTSGADGGPWVVNFSARDPVFSGGASAGTAPIMAIIGATSWHSSDPNVIKDSYASQFRQNTAYPLADYGGYGAGNIGSLLRTLCLSPVPGGGGQTFAQQGYCS